MIFVITFKFRSAVASSTHVNVKFTKSPSSSMGNSKDNFLFDNMFRTNENCYLIQRTMLFVFSVVSKPTSGEDEVV